MRSGNSSRLLSKTLFHFKNLYKLMLLVSILALAGCDHDDDDDNDKEPDTNISAAAGIDQQVDAQTIVTLSGTGTTDTGTINSYAWIQISGDGVTLINADNATASFTSPSKPTDNVLTFELTVTDTEGNFATDAVDITVKIEDGGGTTPPVAEAGTDKTALYGDVVNLFGIGTDSDGSIVSYQWQQISGTAVTLINPTLPTTKFTVPDIEPVDLVFELTVTDNDGLTATDTVTVSIEKVTTPPDGVVLFETNCGGCHTANGLGSGATDKTGRTAQQITDAIANVNAMSSLDFLTAEEIQAISDAITPEEIDGAQIFTDTCGGCHTGNGLGSGSSDKTNRTAQQITDAIANVGAMGSITLSAEEISAVADALVEGASLFVQECGGCHTANGLGSGSSDKTGRTAEQITNAIANVGAMSGLSDLTVVQIDEIAKAIAPSDGEQLFADNCGSCHTANGLGTGSSDKTARTSAQITQAIANVGAMAGLSDLSSGEIDAIALAILPDGELLFVENCTACHQGNGLGDNGSDKTGRSAEQITNAIANVGAMAGLASLVPEQIDAIAEALAPDGTLLFTDNCTACHQGNGMGSSGSDKTGKTAQQITDAIANVGAMSGLSDLLAVEIDAIAEALAPDGAQLFTDNCTACHQGNGMGSSGSDKTGKTAQQITDAIANVGAMSGLSDLLAVEIDAIAEALAPDGAQLFTDNCTACHQGNGMGSSGSDKTGKTAQQITEAIANVGAMSELSNLLAVEIDAIAEALAPDGAQLFTDNCTGCHQGNGLGSSGSDKTNATVAEINSAIADDRGGMGQFSNFNSAEIQAISDALQQP